MKDQPDTLECIECLEANNDDCDPVVSDSSTSGSSTSSSSGDSMSDDEMQDLPIHPLTSSSATNGQQQQQQQLRSRLNTSGTKFRRLHERSDSGQLRSKLLMKLGIEVGLSGMTMLHGANTPIVPTEASRVVQKGQENAYSVALKGDHGQFDRIIQSATKPMESLSTIPGKNTIIEKSTNSRQRAVGFDASVRVHPIPARSDYSNRMRSVMWVSSTEIQQNAARNSLEFAAEEWDVSKVVNDEDMILYDGERIHPIHFQMSS